MEKMLNMLIEDHTMTIMVFLAFLIIVLFVIFMKKLNAEMNLRESELKNAIMKNAGSGEKDTQTESGNGILDGISEEVEENSLYKFLELHHRQALQQSSVQFWFSIFAASIGFLFIIVVIGTSMGNEWYECVVKALPGTMIEVISALFFKQAYETRDRATSFFKELTYEKQVARSVAIASTIEDQEIKAAVQSKIALHIIGLKDEEIKTDQ